MGIDQGNLVERDEQDAQAAPAGANDERVEGRLDLVDDADGPLPVTTRKPWQWSSQ